MESGTRPSLDSKCHHQIIFGKVNFRIPPPPPVQRKLWHYGQANIAAIRRSIISYNWTEQLSLNSDPNWQVKTFSKILLNIMSNFIPNEIKKYTPRDPPWITKPLQTLLKKKNRFFRNYKKNGYKDEDKVRLDSFRIECQEAVESAKLDYLNKLGSSLDDKNTTPKNYWKIIHRALNNCRAKIPPLFHEGQYILDFSAKANHFNDHFQTSANQ